MRDIEAATVAKILVEEVVTRFGIQNIIHSDQGRQFEGKLFHEMCQLLRIEKTRTTPYHPQSDGMVERFNRTLTTMLSAYVNENQTNWDDQIPYVMMAYRSSEHETTEMTPNKLMLGREVCTPLDLAFELPREEKSIPLNKWVWELQERLETAHQMVRQNTGNEMQRQKRIHDKRTNYETFKEGDKVLVYFPVKKVGMSPRLVSFWRGPYTVIRKLSDVVYEVDCGRNRTNQTVYCDRLRLSVQQVLVGEERVDDQVDSMIDIEPGSESNTVEEFDDQI